MHDPKVSFKSLDRLGLGISYVQTAIAKISGLLLMLGLVAASTNFFVKDALFGSLPWLQYAWAVDQSLAVDANLALVFGVLFMAVNARDWPKVVIFTIIGGLLFFVAGVIMDIESVRQSLEITLAAASLRVHVDLGILAQVRSFAVIGLVAFTGMDGVSLFKGKAKEAPVPAPEPETVPEVETETHAVEPEPEEKPKATLEGYKAYLAENPNATAKQAAEALGTSTSTISRFRKELRDGKVAQLLQ